MRNHEFLLGWTPGAEIIEIKIKIKMKKIKHNLWAKEYSRCAMLLDSEIQRIRKENNISVTKNQKKLLEICKKYQPTNDLREYLILAKCKLYILPSYWRATQNSKTIDTKLVDAIAEEIYEYENDIMPKGNFIINNLLEHHAIPSPLWFLFRDYVIYDDFVEYPPLTFADTNISWNQDSVTKQEYIEVKVFGNTSRKDVIDNWNIIKQMQEQLQEYISPKRKLTSKNNDRVIQYSSAEEAADENDNDSIGNKIGKESDYTKRLKIMRIQKKRLKKHYNIK